MKLARLSLAVCALASSFAFAAVLSGGNTGCSSSSGTGGTGGGGGVAAGGGGHAGGGGAAGAGGGGGAAGAGGGGGAAGAGGGGGAAGSGGQATITITSPTAGATVEPTAGTAHITTPMAFTVTNFTLADPNAGTCTSSSSNESANCGHVHEVTDGTACTPSGGPYNNFFNASPGNVWLDLCTDGVCGSKSTVLDLHNNDHSPYHCNGACPNGISATVAYTVDPTAAACGDGGTTTDASGD